MRIDELETVARRIRRDVVEMIACAGSGHPGGSLSAVEILTVLFFSGMRLDPARPEWEDRDRFVLSKGHASSVLYSALAERGYFPPALLNEFSQDGSPLQKHPERGRVAGVEFSTGALGQGISAAVGIAMDGKIRRKDYRVYVLIGDGECDEGQVWEAAMAAAHYRLDNLTVFLDHNGLQVDGTNDQVMKLGAIDEKWRSFGWNVLRLDGHDMGALEAGIQVAKKVRGVPTMIVAETVKGKGVSFMENRVEWHARGFTASEHAAALKELL